MRVSSAICWCCALLAAPHSVLADVVAATNMDPGYVSTGWATSIGYYSADLSYTNEAAAQLFVAEVGGPLTTLYATVDRFVGGEPLKISIYTANFSTGVGLPGTLLGSLSIPETQVSGFPPTSVYDLSSLNINLVAGESYVVTFTVATAI